MPNYGVVDLGSNSIRLVIYDVKHPVSAQTFGTHFKRIISDKVVAGLAAFVKDESFTPAGVKRAISVLKGHLKRARYFECVRFDVFATAVLRNCINSDEARTAIEQGVGAPIVLLSSHDEAHLGFVGATCMEAIDSAVLIDIGGGSTEITRVVCGSEAHNESLNVGSLSLFATHVEGLMPTEHELQAISNAVWSTFCSRIYDPSIYTSTHFVGIGGSIRAAAKLYAHIKGLSERPRTLSLADLEDILEFVRVRPNEFIHQALKTSAERVHTIVPGVLIMHRLMSELGGDALEIRKYGVREGYLVERMLGASTP